MDKMNAHTPLLGGERRTINEADLDSKMDKLEEDISNVLDVMGDAYDDIQNEWSDASGMMYQYDLSQTPKIIAAAKKLIKVTNDLITKVELMTNLEKARQKEKK